MREQANQYLLVERIRHVRIGILGSGNEARAGHSSPAHPSLFGPDITSRLARTSRSSSELHCHYHFSGSWEREISPVKRDTPIAASCVSRPQFDRLSLPTITPAGFLTTTVYSRLGLPSPRMVPCHSTPPTPVLLQTVQEKL